MNELLPFRIFRHGVLFLAASLPLCLTAQPLLRPAFVSFLGAKGVGYMEEWAQAVALDRDNNILVAWNTSCQDLPLAKRYGFPLPDAMGVISKISPEGDRLMFHIALNWAKVRGVAADAAGNIYLVGDSSCPSEYFPSTNAFQPLMGGYMDAFVAKLSPDGTNLLYCTYLGGNGLEFGTDIAVDDSGNAWVTGWTSSTNFPVTPSAAQQAIGGGFDAFVAKLAPDGMTLLYSSYLGGAASESGASIAVDGAGRAFVAGSSTSASFAAGPAASRVGAATQRNAYVARLSPDGTTIEALTFVGGSTTDYGLAVALDTAGFPYLLGVTESADFPVTPGCLQPGKKGPIVSMDYFLAKIDKSGSSLVYGTFLGGSSEELWLEWSYEAGYYLNGSPADLDYLKIERGGLAVDAAGNAYVAASTTSFDLGEGVAMNGSSGDWEVFLAKINPAGSAVPYLAYLGGSHFDIGVGLALRGEDDVLIVGSTGFTYSPPHLPVTPNAFQPSFGGSVGDSFVARYVRAASAPANDAFASRIPISLNPATVRADNSMATREAGEPGHGGQTSGRTLWWSWTAPSQGRLILSTAGSAIASVLAVYSGTDVANLTRIALSEDPWGDDPVRRLVVPVERDAVCQIAVDGLGGAAGELALSVSFSEPVNDDYGNRKPITGFPVTVSGSNRNATFEYREDLHERYARHSVWWSWLAPSSRVVRVTIDQADVLPVITVYEADPASGLQRLGGAVGSVDSAVPPEVTFLAVEGKNYEIAVDGYADETGSFVFTIGPGIPPENDSFTNAPSLTGFEVSVQGTNTTATLEPGEPLIGRGGESAPEQHAGQTVWWSWLAPTNGYARISTAGTTFGSYASVFTGNAIASLNWIAIIDNAPDPSGSAYFPVVAGTTYHIQVDAWRWSAPGVVNLSIRLTQPPEIKPESLRKLVDGTVAFQARLVAGHQYRLQLSQDLVTWSPSGDLLQGGEVEITHKPSPGEGHVFYRLQDVTPGSP